MGTIENEQMEQKKPSFFLRISSIAVFGFPIKEICTCARYIYIYVYRYRNSIQIFYIHNPKGQRIFLQLHFVYCKQKVRKQKIMVMSSLQYMQHVQFIYCIYMLLFFYICACYYVLVIILYAHKTATIALLQCGGQRRAKSI